MSQKDDAKKILNEFAAKPSATVWPHLSKAKIAAGALERLDDPDRIDQADANVCGPTCFVRSVITDMPHVYARAVVHLYSVGVTSIGVGSKSFFLKPSSALKDYVLPKTARINQADWILLASIRDSENFFFNFSSINDSVAGITMPGELASWYEQAGYTDVRESTNLLSSKGSDNAQEASDLYAKGYKVSLFINSNMLDISTQNNRSSTADHWVALASTITLAAGTATIPKRTDCFRDAPGPRVCVTVPEKSYHDPKLSVALKVFTWGKVQSVPDSGLLATNAFVQNYYGYVACRY